MRVDDLERIVGIGPVREQQLYELGILTFAQLAAADGAGLAAALGCGLWAVAGWQGKAAALNAECGIGEGRADE